MFQTFYHYKVNYFNYFFSYSGCDNLYVNYFFSSSGCDNL